jgi:FtsP/CotA-like multicopper oxidase with cupredoxin domain
MSKNGTIDIGRRRLIGAAGAAGLVTLLGSRHVSAAEAHAAMPPAEATTDFKPDLELELNAVAGEIRVLPGNATRVWRFTGRVVRGDPGALTFLDGSGHVPVIRTRRGQKLRIHFTNQLPEDSIVHWHGLHIVQRMDGHPMYAIGTAPAPTGFIPIRTSEPGCRSISDSPGCFSSATTRKMPRGCRGTSSTCRWSSRTGASTRPTSSCTSRRA